MYVHPTTSMFNNVLYDLTVVRPDAEFDMP